MFEKGEKVRIAFGRAQEEHATYLRGRVIEEQDYGIKVIGLRVTKWVDPATGKAVEKPIDAEPKVYVVPFAATTFIEVILKGTKEDELDERIKAEPIMQRIGRQAIGH